MGLLGSLEGALLCHIFLLDRNLVSQYSRLSFIDRLLFLIIHLVDRFYAWHRLPVCLELLYLEIRRSLHQRYNLINVGSTAVQGGRYNAVDYPYRTPDGSHDDPFYPQTGCQGAFFGRNMLPSPQHDKLLKPHPMVVATKLLSRRKMVDTGKQFNVLVATWIQFMIHDWVDHVEDTTVQAKLSAPPNVAPQCPLKAFKFLDT